MKSCLYPVFVLCLLFAASSSIYAQGIFMQLTGIHGESTDAAHYEWIEVDAYSHSLSNLFMIGQQPGTPVHTPIVVVKRLDISSVVIFNWLNKGHRIDKATIEFARLYDGIPVVYFQVKLDTAYVTTYDVQAAAPSGLTESVSFLYERITLTYWPVDEAGNPGSPIYAGWDVVDSIYLSAQMTTPEVYVDDGDVVFAWRTLSESGNYGFEVQHQEDGTFRRAAYVPAAGWSTQPLEYEVRVRGLDEGLHTFRIASLGLGGKTTYSDELQVALGVPEGVLVALDPVYPNPFSDQVNLSVSIARDEDAKIAIWDVLGREVAVVYDGMLRSGAKSTFVFEAGGRLPAGVYVIRVATDNGVATRTATVAR